MIAAVREIVPEADPKPILVDFESAAMTEFQNSYLNTEINPSVCTEKLMSWG